MSIEQFYQTSKKMLSFAPWRNRLVFWCGAVIVGIMAAVFAFISDYAQQLFFKLVDISPLIPLVLSPLMIGLAAWLTMAFVPSTAGSGIQQAIAAHGSKKPEERRFLLGWKVIVGKILFTAIALLGGASIGREGPTVQIGAAILYLCAVYSKMSEETSRNVILAGAAAGIAAAFNTPLAGIVFAIEEMARAFEQRYSGVVLTAIVLAGAASLSILGNYSYFGFADGNYSLGRDWLAIGIIGVIGGLLGGLFARVLSMGSKHIRLQLKAIYKKTDLSHPVIFAILCGLVIALLGFITQGATYGTGYEQAKGLLHNEATGSWFYMIAKFIATLVSGLSGIPGGIFSPSLSVGANFGASIAAWFPSTPVVGVVLLGMTAYFAGVTQAPITAFIIVLEITGRQSLPVPLIATSVIASAVSRLICPVSLYHALAKSLMEQHFPKKEISEVEGL